MADKVEHVARLNERGNRLLLLPEPTPEELRQARPRLEWGLQPDLHCNPVCSMEWGLQPRVLPAVAVGVQAAALCRRRLQPYISQAGGAALRVGAAPQRELLALPLQPGRRAPQAGRA